MLADIAGERLDVVMEQRMFEFCGIVFDNHVLVNFHVGHGGILISQTAFEAAFAATEERQLIKAGAAVAKFPAKEEHAQSNVIAVEARILDGSANFVREFGSESFVGVDQ